MANSILKLFAIRSLQFANLTCIACQKNIQRFDYKNSRDLRHFLNTEFEIKKGKRNGLCKKHQRRLAKSIKIARQLALLPTSPKQERNPVY